MKIQWYPGHMTKAMRMMQENIKLVDVIIEVTDARIPQSSRNPDIAKLAVNKIKVILLNKYDLADDNKTKEWKEYYESEGYHTALVNSKAGKGVRQVNDVIMKACKEKIERDRKRGIINRPVRAMIVGIPNVGKSTFIKLILKEIDADEGTIRVGDFKVTELSNREIPQFRRKVGTVFQDFRLLPKKTVFENVAFAMEVLHKTPRQIRKQVPQILSLVGISDKAHKYPDELSAGEQQRVAIARAIVNNPAVLIADEPTGNLDPHTAWEIMDLLDQINLRGTTIVMVTHAKDIVDKMQKRVIAIEKGRIVRDEAGQYSYAKGGTQG